MIKEIVVFVIPIATVVILLGVVLDSYKSRKRYYTVAYRYDHGLNTGVGNEVISFPGEIADISTQDLREYISNQLDEYYGDEDSLIVILNIMQTVKPRESNDE